MEDVKKMILSGLLVLLPVPTLLAEGTNSITQWGITWTFDRQYESGRFASGDYWVVGPVKIISIDPPSVTVQSEVKGGKTQKYDPGKVGATFAWIKNGSMINPSPITTGQKQGYDNTAGQSPSIAKDFYDPALNVAIGVSKDKPLTVQAGSSLVSTISHATPFTYPDVAAVLTVLKKTAPEGSFRPSYSGTDKSIHYNKSQLKWDLLLKLEPVASTPKIEEVEQWFEKPWLDHVAHPWLGAEIHPVQNLPWYPAEMCRKESIASLMLLLDLPKEKKEKLLISFVQVGIDLYEIYTETKDNDFKHRWVGGAGYGSGRKWPIVFAGVMLDNKNMQQVKMLKMCSEDGQTYYGKCWTGATVCWGIGHSNRIEGGAVDHEESDPSSWTCDGRGNRVIRRPAPTAKCAMKLIGVAAVANSKWGSHWQFV